MWKPQGIYADFILQQPTVFFGKDAVKGLATFPGAKVAIIHGHTLNENVKENLKQTFKKKAVYFCERSWESEPDLENIKETIAFLEEKAPDIIISIGGGAVIDGTKLCRLFYEFPSYEHGRTKINQLEFKTKFVAVPTTIGSGSEVSSAAVFINSVEKKKEMIVCHDLQPSVVVLDPELIVGTPEKLLVASCVDAMAHIVEGCVSNVSNELAEMQAYDALRDFYEELTSDSLNEIDILRLQYAGYKGGIVQNHCIVGAAHGVAHQLAGFGYSHGEAVSLILPAVIRCNYQDEMAKTKYDKMLCRAGIASVEVLVTLIESLTDRVGISDRKNELKQLLNEQLNNQTFVLNIIRDQGAKGNPVKIDKQYLQRLIGEM